VSKTACKLLTEREFYWAIPNSVQQHYS